MLMMAVLRGIGFLYRPMARSVGAGMVGGNGGFCDFSMQNNVNKM
jgi:hypothetical protein